jgi:hypothetical protein
MSDELVPVTSWSRNRRHYARPDAMQPCERERGRYGTSLCNSRIKTTVYDQDWLDYMRGRWFGAEAGSQLIVELKPCKQCDKAAASVGADT